MKTRNAALLFMLFIFLSTYLQATTSYRSAFGFAQQQDTLVKVTGKVLDAKTGDPIGATIFYEKLPYYDDMGTVKSSAKDGSFEIYLLNQTSYSIQLRAEGYDAVTEEFKVAPEPGSGFFAKEFALSPDKANQMIVLENLIFERGRSKISSESFEELDKLVDWLNERPNMVIQLEGHTDFEGNANANTALSQERVDAVKEYVVSKGVKKTRVLTKAFGGAQPLTLERTDEAKQKNRRVEVRVIRE